MANKKFWVGMLVLVLTFGMTVIGCDNGNGTTGGTSSPLDGTWGTTNGVRITISGSKGIISAFGSSPVVNDAANKHFIEIGSTVLQNLYHYEESKWSGRVLQYKYNSSTPSVCIDTEWHDCTITINAKGDSFTIYAPDSLTRYTTYVRTQ